MKIKKPTYEELEKRVAIAEPIVEALKRLEVDAVVGEDKIAFMLLQEVGGTLRETEAEFRAMFDLPGIGMVQADPPALRLTRVNRKFCEMMGFSAAELLAMTYIGLTHPLDRPRGMKELARVLRGQADSWSITKRCIRKDGSAVTVDVNGAVVRDNSGRAVRILAMFSDATAQNAAGNKLSGGVGRRVKKIR